MEKHLVFFDRECAFCQRAVQWLISIDTKKVLLFAPFRGEMADQIFTGPLAHYRKANSLVFVENYDSTHRRFSIRSKAIHRIYWRIGGKWKILGLFSWLPAWMGDIVYRFVANHRHQFKLEPMHPLGPSDRFIE